MSDCEVSAMEEYMAQPDPKEVLEKENAELREKLESLQIDLDLANATLKEYVEEHEPVVNDLHLKIKDLKQKLSEGVLVPRELSEEDYKAITQIFDLEMNIILTKNDIDKLFHFLRNHFTIKQKEGE